MRYSLRFREVDRAGWLAIKTGLKSVETRAATVKYHKIKPGDILTISCGGDSFQKTVKKVQHFDSIEELVQAIGIAPIMPDKRTIEEVKAAYHSYPGYREKIKQYGLMALELA